MPDGLRRIVIEVWIEQVDEKEQRLSGAGTDPFLGLVHHALCADLDLRVLGVLFRKVVEPVEAALEAVVVCDEPVGDDPSGAKTGCTEVPRAHDHGWVDGEVLLHCAMCGGRESGQQRRMGWQGPPNGRFQISRFPDIRNANAFVTKLYEIFKALLS